MAHPASHLVTTLACMKQVEYFQWKLPRQRDGKMRLARWAMTEEQAAGYPGAVKASMPPELRWLPETPAEESLGSTAMLNTSAATKARLVLQRDEELSRLRAASGSGQLSGRTSS